MFLNIHVVQQRIVHSYLNSQKPGLPSLADHVLHYFVVIRALLLVFGEHSVNTVDCSVAYELLKIRILHEVADVVVEYNIIC